MDLLRKYLDAQGVLPPRFSSNLADADDDVEPEIRTDRTRRKCENCGARSRSGDVFCQPCIDLDQAEKAAEERKEANNIPAWTHRTTEEPK